MNGNDASHGSTTPNTNGSASTSGATPAFAPPARQTALTVNDNDEVTIWHEAACPSLPPDQVYVRVDAVALNPSDTKMRGAFATPWAFLGTDYCGTVVAVGSDVRDADVKVGDRVYGAQNEMCPRTPDQGAFAEYTVTRGRVWVKVPEGWSTEAAAALPAGISTAGLALKLLGIPLPYTEEAAKKRPSKTTYVLVYGGSTATATITMQFLREYVVSSSSHWQPPPKRMPVVLKKYFWDHGLGLHDSSLLMWNHEL